MVIKLCPRKILIANIFFILFLLCANVLGIVSKLYFGRGYFYGLVPLFDFNSEQNIPTFYSSIALIISSALLFLIALNCKKNKSSYIPWLGLSLIFLFLSIDEISSIHEKLTVHSREIFGTSGFLYYAWVIPYGLALGVFIILYSKFLLELPKNTMLLFLTSGGIYVLGAIGFESLGGRQAELLGLNNILYSFYYTCEEFFEMLGIAIFIYTLLTYIVNQSESLIIFVTNNKRRC